MPKKKENQKIWVLKDNRAGNYSQGLGLAKVMGNISNSSVEVKNVAYNFLAKLPNFLKINGFSGINCDSKKAILNQEQKPDIIISAGRKTAILAASLRRIYKCKAVQIMNPNLNFNKFDCVILPEHDKVYGQNNVITCIGALGLVDKILLKNEAKKFSSVFDKIKSPKIVLLVGGSSKGGNFTTEVVNNLANICSAITNEMGGHLLVVSSRRTGEEIENILEENLQCQKSIFTWQENKNNNPYFAILQNADFIIATGDSISMCCEICCLGKPIYIYNPSEICSKKHLEFHDSLFFGGFARKLSYDSLGLKKYSPNILGETNRVAQEVLKIL